MKAWTPIRILLLLPLFFGVQFSFSQPSDFDISLLKFYGHAEGEGVFYIGDKRVVIKKGDKLEFSEYDPLEGTHFDIIDIGVTVANRSPRLVSDLEVRVSIAPKVGYLIFIEGLEGSGTSPSTADKEATERTAEWFAPVLLFRKAIDRLPPGSSVEVLFEAVDLGAIIRQYVTRKLWPTQLRIDASVEPKGREDTFLNNSGTRYLRIKLPPY